MTQPSATPTNELWRLARRPKHPMPVPEDFDFHRQPLPEPEADQVLGRTIYLSLDPYQWARRRNGVENVGEVCHGRTVSVVLRSRHPEFKEGDFIFNTHGWQSHGLTGAGVSQFNYMFPRRLDPHVAPISTAVGVMGMLGLTAYSGLVLQCAPRPGETVVVSAASGGVGQIVAQIGKIMGCRVVGIAGTQDKCDYMVQQLHLDACVSHREPHFREALAHACPDGIDVYFENVGGAVFEGVLPLLNHAARISLCGMIAELTASPAGGNPADRWRARGQSTFERNNIAVHNLAVGNFVAEHQEAFFAQMGQWIRDGLIHYREDIWPGLENAPRAFIGMLGGDNFGKTLIAVSPDPSLPTFRSTDRRQGDALGLESS